MPGGQLFSDGCTPTLCTAAPPPQQSLHSPTPPPQQHNETDTHRRMHATAHPPCYNVLTTKAAQMTIDLTALFAPLNAILAALPVPNAEEQAYIDAQLAYMEANPLTDSEFAAALAAMAPVVWE